MHVCTHLRDTAVREHDEVLESSRTSHSSVLLGMFLWQDYFVWGRLGKSGDGVGAGGRAFEMPKRFPRRNSAKFEQGSGRSVRSGDF